MTRWLRRALFLALLGFALLLLRGYAREHPEDMPWTDLDLAQPIGAFTGRKLAGLERDGDTCSALLARAGAGIARTKSRNDGPQCSYRDAIRFSGRGAVSIRYRPDGLSTSCPVAAGLALWEWHVAQPAAIRHLGTKIASIDHFGSYGCRRMGRQREGGWSEHATANAVDIAGFRFEDGRRINLLEDWGDAGAKGRFLREIRDGACRTFATVLSPDYNDAHRDHFHFDQAQRGSIGWRACR